MEIKICHMYPDVLNLYGDRGNIICMKHRLERRGISADILSLPIGTASSFSDSDIIFIGGGQDFEQELILNDLAGAKTDNLRSAVEDGVSVLAICGGYQMLGAYYETHDGKKLEYTNVIDIYTVGKEKRMTGNLKFLCTTAPPDFLVVGFENHSGRTYLGSGVLPLGRVISGFGNNGDDGTEGARYKNVFGSYCHGPILPKNPAFCDYLLLCALRRKYGISTLEKLDDTIEMLAHNEISKRI